MKIGIIASSGGSVIYEVYPYLCESGINLVVATDRTCGIEELCIKNNVIYRRFQFVNPKSFSAETSDFFKANGVNDLVFLYYLRLVTKEIYAVYNTLNFHPSLLPLFPGLNPISKQKDAKLPLLGATVHKVDHSCDGGPLIGQIANSYTLDNIERISFLQKVFLTLTMVDNLVHKPDQQVYRFLNTNLALSNPAFNFFSSIQNKYKLRII